MERRSFPRVPLDMPVFIRMRLPTGGEQKVLLVDISCGGMQVALSAQVNKHADLLGTPVLLFGLPAPLDTGTTGKGGSITWVSPQRCGIRFDEPVAPAEGDAPVHAPWDLSCMHR